MRYMILIMLVCLSLSAQQKYKFGVFPHMPLEKLHDVFDPVAKDLAKDVKRPVVLMTKPYYKMYKDELNAGLYDIALIQPFDYLQARKEQGYIPIARRAKGLRAILVVSKGSDYYNISDIKDRIIASAPAEAAVTQMMLVAFKQQGYRPLDDFTISYSKNHFVCLQKVVNAKAVACITARRALKYFNKEKGMDTFRTIYTTQKLPHALFVVHPRVPKEIREQFQNRIINWSENAEGREILDKGNLLNFVETNDAEYDKVREFIKTKE